MQLYINDNSNDAPSSYTPDESLVYEMERLTLDMNTAIHAGQIVQSEMMRETPIIERANLLTGSKYENVSLEGMMSNIIAVIRNILIKLYHLFERAIKYWFGPSVTIRRNLEEQKRELEKLYKIDYHKLDHILNLFQNDGPKWIDYEVFDADNKTIMNKSNLIDLIELANDQTKRSKKEFEDYLDAVVMFNKRMDEIYAEDDQDKAAEMYAKLDAIRRSIYTYRKINGTPLDFSKCGINDSSSLFDCLNIEINSLRMQHTYTKSIEAAKKTVKKMIDRLDDSTISKTVIDGKEPAKSNEELLVKLTEVSSGLLSLTSMSVGIGSWLVKLNKNITKKWMETTNAS